MARIRAVRGVSVLLVLALLSMTLALTYSITRTGTILEQSQTNYERLDTARQAAYAGLHAALRKLKQSDWGGVDSQINGTLEPGVSYQATFTTGDPTLTENSAEYSQLPYRLTITSTGTASNPTSGAVASQHRVQAILKFVPRQLGSAAPSLWDAMQNYTLIQWGTSSGSGIKLNLPARIEGPVLSQNSVQLAPSYPGAGDELPFAGNIDEVAVLGKALSSDQILQLWNGDSTGIFTGNGQRVIGRWRFNEAASSLVAQDQEDDYDGLYDGGKPGGSAAPFGGSGSAIFDGVNDHVHLGAVDASGDELTILAWVRPTSFPSDAGRIVSKASSSDSDDQYWTLSHYLTNGRRSLRFRLKTSIGGTTTLSATNVTLSSGQWTFIAAVYDGWKMKVYQNGQLANETFKLGWVPSGSSVFASIGNSPPGSPRAKYLRDLRRMLTYAGIDYLPFNSSLTAPVAKTSSDERSLLTDELQGTWTDFPTTVTFPLSHPGKVESYRLYPGGKEYPVPALTGTLKNRTLAPDPATNPLGVFYRSGNLDVENNVSITGVVIINANDSTPDMEIYGTNVKLQSVTLPTLDGTSSTSTLPVALVKDDLRIYGGASAEIDGLAATWGEFGFLSGSQSTQFQMRGRALVNDFYVEPRTEWNQSNTWWKERMKEFYGQLTSSNAVLYFPQWLKNAYGLDPEPKLILKPPAGGTSYHWVDWTQPIFAAHPDDGGLRWELLAIREVQ